MSIKRAIEFPPKSDDENLDEVISRNTDDEVKVLPPKVIVSKGQHADGRPFFDFSLASKRDRKRIAVVFGDLGPDHAMASVDRLVRAIIDPVLPGGHSSTAVNGALAMVADIAPKNAIETMLATQLVTLHQAILRLQAMAMNTFDPLTSARYLTLVSKLTKAMALTSETLDRHRGKAGQKIVVERVNVSEGGKAIVGEVNRSAKEGM